MRFTNIDSKENGGADGHPSLEKHEAMAEELAQWIRKEELLSASDPTNHEGDHL